jgi:O-antigen/teichoic acid export membrane protein
MQIIDKLKRLWSDQDERNLLIHIALAFGVKGLALVLSFFSMPLYIRFFGNDDVLGLWYTILSMLSWVHICDLGLGNGLRNRLTEALAVGDTEKAKRFVSST